jgi:hypothetical protein
LAGLHSHVVEVSHTDQNRFADIVTHFALVQVQPHNVGRAYSALGEGHNRAALGFTPILPNTELWVGQPRPGYSQILEVYGASQRTRRAITFRMTQDGYEWIGEMEMHYGPKTFTTFQGSSQEKLVVEYSTEPYGGNRTANQIKIRYFGDDMRLRQKDLTLADIKPFLQECGRISIR